MGCCPHCAELRRRIEALERRRGPRDAADLALLHVLAALERSFTASAVFRHARLNESLAAALDAADISGPRELGWFLNRCEGQHAGFLVERLREAREGLWWKVTRV